MGSGASPSPKNGVDGSTWLEFASLKSSGKRCFHLVDEPNTAAEHAHRINSQMCVGCGQVVIIDIDIRM
jgi:hypothetical protein